ncbi:MAG: ATP-binding protein [Angustibacter sp.]
MRAVPRALLRWLVHVVAEQFLRPGRGVRRRWRRSLQLRVVTATMLLGLFAAAGVGTLLVNQIEAGLIRERLVTARGEADRGRVDAQAQFDTVEDIDGFNLLLNDLLPRLASPDPDDSREVVILRPATATRRAPEPDLGSRDIALSVVPSALRGRVVATGRQEEQFVRIRYSGSTRSAPGIAIGSVVDVPVAGPYELYFVFSLQREQDTLSLVRQSLLVGGGILVLLVGGVAYVVTRQVVRPVRQAAAVAHRLSSGRLTERMVPRGEDDLARLAASFNTMAQNLQRQIGQLENLSQVQQRFVSDVSHELRTPLTTVRMASDVLHEAREGFAPQVARSAELLVTQLDRFEALLADLLEISRIDAGGDLLDREPTDLREVVDRVVDGCSALSATSGSTVAVLLQRALTTPVRDPAATSPAVAAAGTVSQGSVDEPVAPIAEVDPRRIERILRNLVVNALEHGEGQPVVIRIAADPDVVAVSVRDHGVGLRPGEAALVFNRFWRADPSRARKVGGNGLGLAIAIEDARLHGGWLQAWGEPGGGSCFRLTLPRRDGVDITGSPLPLTPSDAVATLVGQAYQRLPAPLEPDPATAMPRTSWAVDR